MNRIARKLGWNFVVFLLGMVAMYDYIVKNWEEARPRLEESVAKDRQIRYGR
jgi:hypothetical protein